MPLVSQTFSQLIDFTRTTAGTYVDSTGKIVSTPASRNLLTFTQQFDNAAWSKNNAAVTANTTTAPDGTLTADKLEETATTAVHNAGQSITTSAVAYTWSCYVKAAERNFALLYHTQSNSSLAVNLTTGATGTASGTVAPTSSSVVAVGNGWWRVSMTVTATAASNFFGVYVMNDLVNASYAGVAGSGIFIWGAQLELGALTDYTRNVGGVFPARFDYDPVTLAPRGLLIEEQRANLLTYSAEFDNAAWTKSNATATANTIAAPDGTTTADTLAEDTATGVHSYAQTFSATSGTSYALSGFFKNGDGRYVQLLFGSAGHGTTAFANFDLQAGTVGTVGATATATITNFGNGWYRCSIVSTATATTSSASGQFVHITSATSARAENYTGTSKFIYGWGAQLEARAFATSYIPTVASQVTRAADIAAITGPNFTPWYNQSAGTFVVSVDSYAEQAGVNAYNILSANDGTTNNFIRPYVYATNAGETVRIAASTVAEISRGTWSQNVPFNLAATYAANDFIVALNGALSSADTSGAVPTANQLALGANNGVGSYLNGHIRSIRYYPSRLTDAQLQALTA